MNSVHIHQLIEEDQGIAEIRGQYQCFSVYPDAIDYVSATRDLLYDWLVHINKLPINITFALYDALENKHIDWFEERNITYTLFYTIIDQKKDKITYKSPMIEATVTTFQDLFSVLDFTFWLPTQNEFFVVSFNNGILLEESSPYSTDKRIHLIPILEMKPETTFITIAHDAQGLLVLSNKKGYQSINTLKHLLPPSISFRQD